MKTPRSRVHRLIVLTLAAIIGCTAADMQPETITPVDLAYEGVVVGSFGFDGIYNTSPDTHYRLFYRSLERDFTDCVILSSSAFNTALDGHGNVKNDFREGSKWGVPFAIMLPPGKYEFTGWSKVTRTTTVYSDGQGGTITQTTVQTWWSSGSYPFTVSQGGIQYVGEVMITPTFKDSEFLGIPFRYEAGGPRAIVSDRWDRDRASFAEMYPTVRWEEAEFQTDIWNSPQTPEADGIPKPPWFYGYTPAQRVAFIKAVERERKLNETVQQLWDRVSSAVPQIPIIGDLLDE